MSPVSKSLNHSPLRTFPRHHLTSSSTLTVSPNIQHHPSTPLTTIRVLPLEKINGGKIPYLTNGHHKLLQEILPTFLSMPPTPHHHVLSHSNALPMHAIRQHLVGEPHHHHNRTCSPSNHKHHSAGSISIHILSPTNRQGTPWTHHSSGHTMVSNTTQQNHRTFLPPRAGSALCNSHLQTLRHPI